MTDELLALVKRKAGARTPSNSQTSQEHIERWPVWVRGHQAEQVQKRRHLSGGQGHEGDGLSALVRQKRPSAWMNLDDREGVSFAHHPCLQKHLADNPGGGHFEE